MKKNIYLILILSFFTLLSKTSSATVHIIATVSSPAFAFSPDSVSANVGDTAVFVLPSFHSAVEVSQATWNVNDSTSNGGFRVPVNGGIAILSQAKTYYYVCGIHFGMGMKGRIFVSNTTGIKIPAASLEGLEIFPNPASGWITVKAGLQPWKESRIRIINVIGNCIYERVNIPSTGFINLAGIPTGVYFVEVKSGEMIMEKKLVVSR